MFVCRYVCLQHKQVQHTLCTVHVCLSAVREVVMERTCGDPVGPWSSGPALKTARNLHVCLSTGMCVWNTSSYNTLCTCLFVRSARGRHGTRRAGQRDGGARSLPPPVELERSVARQEGVELEEGAMRDGTFEDGGVELEDGGVGCGITSSKTARASECVMSCRLRRQSVALCRRGDNHAWSSTAPSLVEDGELEDGGG